MSTEATLLARSGSKCELCSAKTSLSPYVVAPHTQLSVDHCVMICDHCRSQLENPEQTDVNHWHCLNESMWSEHPPVQVLAWRQLKQLSAENGWAHDLLDMMYMEENVQKWAESGLNDVQEKTLDANGAELNKGDSVTVIKDLPIKGTKQVIKQGTVIRGIGLSDDPTLVSGKVNGQSMYVIAAFCRKK